MRYLTYRDRDGSTRVGIVDEDGEVRPTDQPDLLAVIEAGTAPAPSDPPVGTVDDLDVVAPIPRPRRNVFCVGKNYAAHAQEFSASGYDASAGPADADTPRAPVVFSKPPSSVIGTGAPIDPHPAVTSELDYEAELGVIIGRGGRDIPVEEAAAHVWGYTIINDVTARDRQRDHRQWLLGKGLDTFCPMGPLAVTADEIDPAGRARPDLEVTCRVNGELRQHARTADLLFDIPTLIATISAGLTLEPGDVIATGTPAGVGIGFDPPRFLHAGDEVEVGITGLGTLRNAVAGSDPDHGRSPMATNDSIFIESTGSGPPVVFVHGLGGTTNFYQPQAEALASRHQVIRFDLPGAGRSPLRGTASIESFADALEAVLDASGVTSAHIVGHSMGTIVVQHFAATRPERTERVVLLGPVREQPEAAKEATRARAATVRAEGMTAVADAVVGAATSDETRSERPAVAAFVRELLMGQDAEGYAAHCEALAAATAVDLGKIEAPTLLMTGSDDKTAPPSVAEAMFAELPTASYEVIDGIGHWTAIEAAARVTAALQDFLA